MPTGPWGYGMDKCIAWVKSHKKDVDDAGAYCGGIKRDQDKSKKALNPGDISYSSLAPLHNEELASLAENLSKDASGEEYVLEAALILKNEMEDRGMNSSSFLTGALYSEATRWSVEGHEKPVPLESIIKYLPAKLSEPVDILLMGEAAQRGYVGRYGSIVLRVNKTERSEALENEVLAHCGCPHVKEKIVFTWGVDPSDAGLPLYEKGENKHESGCSCGDAEPEKLREEYVKLGKSTLSASGKVDARAKLSGEAKRLGVKIPHRSGLSKLRLVQRTNVEIGYGLQPVSKSESIMCLDAENRYWRMGDGTATRCSEPLMLNTFLIKTEEKTTKEDTPYLISRSGRLEVIEFDGVLLTEIAPLSGIYKVSEATPEHTYPYVMHRDTLKDATMYKMYVVKGDDVGVFTMDKPLGSEDAAVTLAAGTMDDVEYVGRHRINGTVVNTEVIGKGMVTIQGNVLTIEGVVYTIDPIRGVINNK